MISQDMALNLDNFVALWKLGEDMDGAGLLFRVVTRMGHCYT